MIKGILASNASKLVASCVCPVAGTVALTVGMPPVRDAVHRATAPRAYALPKTRVRKAADTAPMDTPAPVQTASAAPPCEPVLTAGPIDTPFAPMSLGDVPSDLPDVRNFDQSPERINNDGPTGDNNLMLPGTPGIPEPGTWLNMIVGFGVIGGAARYSLRNRKAEGDAEQG